MSTKPFSTYPEDHAKLLKLADKILNDGNQWPDDLLKLAVELADLVQATLRDEALADEDAAQPDAPDLLAALDALLSEAEDVFNCMADVTGIDRHDYPEPFKVARAALSRATESAQ